MIQLIITIILAGVVSIPVTLGMGLIYLTVALILVNYFKLNYGERPIGFKVLNYSLLLICITYFITFAILLRRF